MNNLHVAGIDTNYLKPVISMTEDMYGTESVAAIRRTMHHYSLGIPEDFTMPQRTSSDISMDALEDVSLSSNEDDDARELSLEEPSDSLTISGDIGSFHTMDWSSDA